MVTAGILLSAIDDEQTRRDVEAALADPTLNLNRSEARDVLAAEAYVWVKRYGFRLEPRLPWTAEAIEKAAREYMEFERRHPGTKDAAVRGSPPSVSALFSILEESVAAPGFTLRYTRKSDVDDALDADSEAARAIVGASSTSQEWVAHHIIPFAVVAALPRGVQLSIVAGGWVMDSEENLIALPGNWWTYWNAPNSTFLPEHSGPHILYSAEVAALLAPVAYAPAEAVVPTLRTVETTMRDRIIAREFNPHLD